MKVTRFSTTPIKGLTTNHPQSVEITPTGILGDRQFFLVDENATMISIGMTGEFLPWRAEFDANSRVLSLYRDGELEMEKVIALGTPIEANFFNAFTVPGTLVDGGWSEVFSQALGRSLRLVHADAPNGAKDVGSLTLLGTESTAELARRSGLDAVDPDRFRIGIEFDGGTPHEEDTWNGRQLRIGEVVLEVEGPVQRCAATTRNPQSGEVDLKTLTLIGDYRGRQESILGLGFNFGVYAKPVTTGRINIGDALELL